MSSSIYSWCDEADQLEVSGGVGSVPIEQTAFWVETGATDGRCELEAVFPVLVLEWDSESGGLSYVPNANVDPSAVLLKIGPHALPLTLALNRTFCPDDIQTGQAVTVRLAAPISGGCALMKSHTQADRRGVGAWHWGGFIASCGIGTVRLATTNEGHVGVAAPRTPEGCAGLWVRLRPGDLLISLESLLHQGNSCGDGIKIGKNSTGQKAELFVISETASDDIRGEWKPDGEGRYCAEFDGTGVHAVLDVAHNVVVVDTGLGKMPYAFCTDRRAKRFVPLSTSGRFTVIDVPSCTGWPAHAVLRRVPAPEPGCADNHHSVLPPPPLSLNSKHAPDTDPAAVVFPSSKPAHGPHVPDYVTSVEHRLHPNPGGGKPKPKARPKPAACDVTSPGVGGALPNAAVFERIATALERLLERPDTPFVCPLAKRQRQQGQ